MTIGIDASRAFIKNRTGIEEYSYQVINGLKKYLQGEQVILYVRKNQEIDFELLENWRVKVIKFPRFWTQLGLSLEMFFHPVDALFVPAHTVPIIHPANTIVTVHGLEYEFCPKAYSFWERIYMRISIKNSCRWAKKIISVSENTKKDLMQLYNVKEDKIRVIYEGYGRETRNFQFPISNSQSNYNDKFSNLNTKYEIQNTKYLLFIGRIEERKNIFNIIKAFEILKEKFNIEHKLVLAGKQGYGYEKIKDQIENSKHKNEILELGFVSEQEKWQLLKMAEVFVFPTLYEGFGIPVLEAQSVGCPVVASGNSSISEVVADSGLLIDPCDSDDISEAAYKLISDESLKNAIISKGLKNVQRFSWDKCSREISEILKK